MCDCGKLIVISGPSGAGKSTIIEKVMRENPNLVFSVSVTTRSPRAGEANGQNYFFIDKTRFDEMAAAGELLEYAEYVDNYYGTPRDAVYEHIKSGRDVVFDIEVQGAMQIKRKCPDAIMIFIVPSSFFEIENRLRARGTDGEEVINRRIEEAKRECRYAPDYRYLVFNDDPKTAVAEINAIITAEKCRMENRKRVLEDFVKN